MRRIALLLALASLIGCDGEVISTNNSPPSATILQPSDGATFSETVPLELLGVVGDTGTAATDLRVSWTSSAQGLLFDGAPDDAAGNTRFVWEAPSAGEHTMSLSVIDPAGVSSSASVRITVLGNSAPSCGITAPSGEQALNAGAPVLLQAQVDDAEVGPELLLALWSSSEDGELSSGAPSAGGVVASEVTLSPGVHTLTLTVTDPGGLACTDILELEMNAPPSTPQIALSPAQPTTLSDLLVDLVVPSVDPEGDDVTYTYSWFEDGTASAVTGPTVFSAELDKGETWTVDVRTVDNAGFASASAQASVTIVNSAPSAPALEITPAAPNQAQDLNCAVLTPSTDADGDAVSYGFSWAVDGAPTGLSGAVLSWEETEVGEFWTCTATPTDGTSAGPSASVTAQVQAGCASLSVDPATPGWVSVSDDPALRLNGTDFTVEAWVYPTATGPGESVTIASKRSAVSGDGWHFGIGGLLTSSIRKPIFLVSDLSSDYLVASQVVALNRWSHVAMTFDSSSSIATLWLDGANIGSGALTMPPGTTATDLRIGADASTGDLPWLGVLDDVRISDAVRYSAPFVPASQLFADASTVAWWGFEEAGGADAKDLSGGGFDGALSGSAAFDSSQSTCANNQAPTVPVVSVTPDFPLLNQDLLCTLVTPSVDPEGGGVTYLGQWLLNGAPSGVTFSSFPATLAAAFTSEGDQWTCSVSANDGVQSGAPGSDAVWTGAMPLGQLSVPDPSAAGLTNLTFAPPMAGLIRATLSNPDASRDGVFSIETLGYGTTWLFTGYRDWAYGGVTVAGWAGTDVEFNVDSTMGTLTLALGYDPTPGLDNLGLDTLTLEFVYGTQLDVSLATFMTGSDVGPQDTSGSQVQVLLAASERLLLQTGSCGFGGGGHSLYADGDGVTGNDGVARVDTGFTGDCLIPLESRPIGAGTWTFTLVNEDDFFTDNTGQREVNLYRYVP